MLGVLAGLLPPGAQRDCLVQTSLLAPSCCDSPPSLRISVCLLIKTTSHWTRAALIHRNLVLTSGSHKDRVSEHSLSLQVDVTLQGECWQTQSTLQNSLLSFHPVGVGHA